MDKELKKIAKICTIPELRLERQELLKKKAELVPYINSEFDFHKKYGVWKDKEKRRDVIKEIGVIKRKLSFIQDKIAILSAKEKEIHRKEREYPEKEKMDMFKEFVRSLDKEIYSKAWELTNERIRQINERSEI